MHSGGKPDITNDDADTEQISKFSKNGENKITAHATDNHNKKEHLNVHDHFFDVIFLGIQFYRRCVIYDFYAYIHTDNHNHHNPVDNTDDIDDEDYNNENKLQRGCLQTRALPGATPGAPRDSRKQSSRK